MREIEKGIFELEGAGWPSNAFLVHGDDPVVVDAGSPRSGRRIVAELRAAGIAPALILLTHSHADHVGGAAAIRLETGAAICAPHAERDLLTGKETHPALVRSLARAANLGRRPRMPAVDRWLEDGEVVAGFEVVATPGHTTGHTCYRHGTALFAGDAVVTGDRFREALGLFTADRSQARRSVEMLAALDVDLALSGHGPPAREATARLQELACRWRT